MNESESAVEANQEDIENSFNKALENLKNSIGTILKSNGEASKTRKRKGGKSPVEEEPESYEEEEGESEEEEEKEEKNEMEKSIDDIFSEDEEAVAAMDVEPFLRQLVKSIDFLSTRLSKLEEISKAQSQAVVTQMELQKSQSEVIEKIAKADQSVKGLRSISKSRFEFGNNGKENKKIEFDGPSILSKSMDWVQTGKMDLVESGMVEQRINKGVLGMKGDELDMKVQTLMEEGK